MLNPALTELVAVATDDGAPVDDGSPMGTALALTAANSTPGECLSVARYRFLHHTAVSFVSSDIRVFEILHVACFLCSVCLEPFY